MSRPESKRSLPKGAAKGRSVDNDAAPFLRVPAEWKGYVNVDISEGAKAQYGAFSDDVGLVQEMAAEVLLRGYKLSVVQVDNDETVRASLTAGFRGMPDEGLSVSAWAESFSESVASVVFIVAIVSGFNLARFHSDGVKLNKRTF